MIRVGILGATGYAARELMKILVRHPEADIRVLTSRQDGNPHVATVHPQLTGLLDIHLENLDADVVASQVEFIFSCLPHGVSAAVIPKFLQVGKRVIDFGADYRLDNADVYQQWYGEKHVDPERLGDAVYGLPELYRDTIKDAQLVANPGCYPTSAILALSPLLRADTIKTDTIIVDSKSGVSGAGRTAKLMTHFPECNESVVAYNVGYHRHTPEIEQVLSDAAGKQVKVIFTPHLVPMDRGILTTSYSDLQQNMSEEQLLQQVREFYGEESFVRVVDHLPATKDTTHTNFCDVTVRLVRNRVITVSCLDNLGKGAAGAAVQNFNLMHGFPEATAL